MLAFSLAQPGLGPGCVSAELSREKWGGLRVSAQRTSGLPQMW